MTSGLRSSVRSAAVLAMATVVVAGGWYATSTGGRTQAVDEAASQPVGPWVDGTGAVAAEAALDRARVVTRELPHGGDFTVVSFSETGPRISELTVARHADALHLLQESHRGRWELARGTDEAVLSSTDASLRLGGTTTPLAQLDRVRDKYHPRLGDEVLLDTGPARSLQLLERDTGLPRETLYLDEDTGLVVRRETFAADGSSVRLIAYTRLEAGAATEVPSIDPPGSSDGRDVHDHARVVVEEDELSTVDGGDLSRSLPGGYELLGVAAVDASTPATHLLYGDGLYTLSLFVQEGRPASSALEDARQATTSDGGAVWRWPGSEPQRVVWSGGGRTFTVLSDAPADELLEVITGLPVDDPPSMLGRLRRGIARVGDWLIPGDGSET